MEDQLNGTSADDLPKRRGRGPGKNPRLISTSIRLPKFVLDFFNNYYPATKQSKMREILTDWITKQEPKNGDQTDTQA